MATMTESKMQYLDVAIEWASANPKDAEVSLNLVENQCWMPVSYSFQTISHIESRSPDLDSTRWVVLLYLDSVSLTECTDRPHLAFVRVTRITQGVGAVGSCNFHCRACKLPRANHCQSEKGRRVVGIMGPFRNPPYGLMDRHLYTNRWSMV